MDDIKQDDGHKACEGLYNDLTDLKRFIFSTAQLAEPEVIAMLLAQKIQQASSPQRSALWLAEKNTFTEIAVNGQDIPPAQRRTVAADASGLLAQVAGEHMVIWSVEPAEKEFLFPGFQSPTLFPIKWQLKALGFIAVDNVTQPQIDLFQFYCQYIALLLNMSHLYKTVKDQEAELNELTGILFSQNSHLAALHKVGLEIAATDNIEHICRLIATATVTEFSSRSAAVLLQDEKSQELRVISAIGLQGIEGLRLAIQSDEKIMSSLNTGRIISYKSSHEVLRLGSNSITDWGIFPFKGRHDNLGVLVAEIADEDISDSLAILVNHGAMVLDTLMLMEEKERLNESLTIRTNELVLSNKRLEQLSVTDQLTGLFNRRHFQERIAIDLSRATRYRRPLSLLMIDIDHFKAVNDTFGHSAGDDVLKEIARRIVATVRLSDLVVRYGGEEIVVLLTDTDLASAKIVAEHIRKAAFDNSVDAHGVLIPVSISIGVAVFPSPRITNGEELYNEADKAMYRAKEAGRNRVEVAD